SKPSGSGINPCFLWDNAAYMLGFKPDDPKPERTIESFEAFRERHVSIEQQVNSDAFTAVCTFLRQWSSNEAARHSEDLSEIASSFGVFKIAGEHGFVHDDADVVAYWSSLISGDEDQEEEGGANRGMCLVTGHTQAIARLHEPKIKNVRGAQSAGALLVSFNDSAYTSYGKEQSYNAPVGKDAAFKYTNALNHLLGREDRRILLGDATVLFWAEQNHPLENFVSELFADAPPPSEDAPAESRKRVDEARRYLTQLREGHAFSDAFDAEDQTRFCILGLSPNASRLSVRFWIDSTAREIAARLAQHIQDTDLIGGRADDPPPIIRRIVQASGRAITDAKGRLTSYDADAVPPLLAGALARAVLTGTAYPQMLLTTMLSRIRADGAVSHTRVAAIKACINRASRFRGTPQEVTVALDPKRTDSSYITGRLFALLEMIQTSSTDGTLNSTIKDRYFSAASATPCTVFPRLIRLSQHHLAKMDTGQKIYYERLLTEVMGKLSAFARHLNLEEQGLFAIGYFHQRQDLFTSKKDKSSATVELQGAAT
ncbi:MAG TPA: type I-C CRISPR-associated protein Cas8c/Csd1, partial [Phycisphaerales bacterium]|nr:type I-C CRISPR-associated protein Cas8c/Csd1 [Phycisphaerales bacterium]